MRKFIAGLMLALSACATTPAPVQDPSPADVAQYVHKITLPEKNGVEEGSGVVISHGIGTSVLLTCAHVVEDRGTVTVTIGKNPVPGYVMAVDKKADLALVQVNEALPAAHMATVAPSLGDVELAVGYPLNGGETITQGFVGQRDPKDGAMEGSAAVMPGNSGGGLFVNQGGWKLAGIVQAVQSFPVMPPFVSMPVSTNSYWIPMERIQAFLKAHPAT